MRCVSFMRVAALVVSFRSKLCRWSYGFTPEIQRVGVWSGWSLLGHGLEMIRNGEEQTRSVVLGFRLRAALVPFHACGQLDACFRLENHELDAIFCNVW